MKKWLVVSMLSGAGCAWAQVPPAAGGAQEAVVRAGAADSLAGPDVFRFRDSRRLPREWRNLPDVLSEPPLRFEVYPWETETSVVQVRNHLPERIDVPSNTPRRITHSLWISNGQAWNWGAYPDAFLDARTLSMPLPR